MCFLAMQICSKKPNHLNFKICLVKIFAFKLALLHALMFYVQNTIVIGLEILNFFNAVNKKKTLQCHAIMPADCP